MPRAEPHTQIVITPIGVVRSPLRDRRDAPNQAFAGAPEAILEINPEFAPALHRVFPGTELIVVTWLHAADRTVLQTHPMGDELSQAGFRGGSERRTIRPPERRTSPDATTEEVSE